MTPPTRLDRLQPRIATSRARPKAPATPAHSRQSPRPPFESRGRAGATGFAHLPALDGLRGLAVLAVVLYHFSPSVAPGGFLGVDLFFVLSGFLITSLLVSEREATRSISLPSFWARRARRLLPALLLVLAAVGVYGLVAASRVDAQHVAVDGLSAFAYVANWHFIASGQSYLQQFIQQAPSPLRHMWSLAIEEQFYLLWPLVVVLVGKAISRVDRRVSQRQRFRHALFAVCLALGATSFLWMITLYHSGGDPNRVYYGTDTRAFVILIGAALGAICVGTPTVPVRWLRGVVVVAGCSAALVLVAMIGSLETTSSWLYEGGYGLVAVLMALVLVAASQPGINPLARLLTFRPLVGLGLISYGVYLWHWPVALWLTEHNSGVAGLALFGLRAAVTMAAAVASYLLVEQPIRRGRLPSCGLSHRGLVPTLLVIAVAIVLLVPAIVFPSVGAAPTAGASTSRAVTVTASYAVAPRCDGSHASRPAGSGGLRVQLVGNSISQEIGTCLGSILAARGATLESLNPAGFKFCEVIPKVQEQVRESATRPKAAIFFALVAISADPVCGVHATWKTPVEQLIRIWKSAGIHIYLVPSVPPAFGSKEAQRRDQIGQVNVLGGGVILRSAADAAKAEASYYHALADHDPAHITVLDAGTFLHDDNGQYLWQMPCLGGESGCSPNHTVGVRWIVDGFHFCYTSWAFALGQCPAGEAGGEHRAAAAVAAGLLPSLRAMLGAGRGPN